MNMDISTKHWSIAICIALFLMMFSAPLRLNAQEDPALQAKLKEEFFSLLERPQIISLMESIDRSKQYTDFELGAKYRWGQIPADRRPPVQVAQWWSELSPRRKSEERYQWFKDNYMGLDLDRAARELGMKDKVNEIYRRLKNNNPEKSSSLEAVPFPDEAVKPPQESQDTEYQGVFRPESLRNDSSSDNQAPSSDASDTNGSSQMSSSSQNSSEPSATTQTGEEKPSNRDADQAKSNDMSQREQVSDTMSEDSDKSPFEYREVGDHIEVVNGDTGERSVTDSDDQSQQGTETNEKETPPFPSLNRRNDSIDTRPLTIPSPDIRATNPQEPRIRR